MVSGDVIWRLGGSDCFFDSQSFVRRFIIRRTFKSTRDDDLLDPDELERIGIPVRCVYYDGDRSAVGPVELHALVKLRDGARMSKAQIDEIMGESVMVAVGDTRKVFEDIERRCEQIKWGLDYGNAKDFGNTTGNKKAKLATAADLDDVANALATNVARIITEARPADEALQRENAALRAENERLKLELENVRTERDEYAVECFELRAKI